MILEQCCQHDKGAKCSTSVGCSVRQTQAFMVRTEVSQVANQIVRHS